MPTMDPVAQGGGGLSHPGGLQEAAGRPSVRDAFELDSCNVQGVGLDGLLGPFQLLLFYDSMTLPL